MLPLPPDTCFDHLVVFGGAPGVAERVRSAGVAEVITEGRSARGAADAVVAFVDAAEPMDAIIASVAPGGVLYAEVDRVRPGRRAATPSRLSRVLDEAGFGAIVLYVVEPDFGGPHAFVPLRSAAALEWYRQTFFRAPNVFAGVVEGVRHAAIRRVRTAGAGLLRRFAVVAARAGVADGLPGILAHPDVVRQVRSDRPMRDAVVTTYGGDRVVLFAFGDGETGPVATIKVPKAPAFNSRTENEQAQMLGLRDRLSPALSRAIPEPWGLARVGPLVAATEQWMPGRSLSARARDRSLSLCTKTGDLARAMRWLADFHRATEVRRVPWGDARATWLDGPLAAYASAVGGVRDEAALFARVRAASDRHASAMLPVVTHHRDFAAVNILCEGDDLSVIDWEGAREGPAMCDAFHLVTTWLYSVRGHSTGREESACVRDLFVSPAPEDSAVRSARTLLAEYAQALRVDSGLQPILLVSYRVELALRRMEQGRLHHGAPVAQQTPSAEVEAVRALATGANVVFAEGDAPA